MGAVVIRFDCSKQGPIPDAILLTVAFSRGCIRRLQRFPSLGLQRDPQALSVPSFIRASSTKMPARPLDQRLSGPATIMASADKKVGKSDR
jgi:hypothetical protein